MATALHKPEIFDKHKCYASAYQPSDTFWGIGIECEGYIETAIRRRARAKTLLIDQRAERYSVPYYKSYKDGVYNQALRGLPASSIAPSVPPTAPSALFNENTFHDFPYLLNAHSLVRTDISGEHTTMFLKVADAADPRGYRYDVAPNPNCGPTILQRIAAADKYFTVTDNVRGEDFIFDGDSIEIATRDFYKATVEDCIQEFKNMRAEFIENLNAAWRAAGLPQRFQPLRWMPCNYPFVFFHSNPKNIAIFNNGTFHFNFTMPTALNDAAKVADDRTFIRRHRSAARLIQWLEPFLIANYGTADPLSTSTIMGHRFSAASQRAATSRYIGVGSYNTNRMLQGKMNTMPREDARVAGEGGWMTSYQTECAYKPLEEVGTDINFHKHYNHGLELRFFDYFAEERLGSLLSTLVHVLDHSQTVVMGAAAASPLWNTVVEDVMAHGRKAQIYSWMAADLASALGVEIRPGPIRSVWHDIQRQLERRWLGRGECSRVMIRRRRSLWEHVERPLGPAAPAMDPSYYLRSGRGRQQQQQPQIPEGVPFQVRGNPVFSRRTRSAEAAIREPLMGHRPALPPEIPEVPARRGGWCGGGCSIQ